MLYTTTFFVCEHLIYLSVKTSLCISAVQSLLTYKFHYSGHWNSCIILAFNVFSPSLCFSFQSTIYLSSKNFLDVWKFIHKRNISYITLRKLICCFLSRLLKTLNNLLLYKLWFLGFTIFMLFQYSVKDLKVLKADATWKIKPQNMATMSACKWETIYCYFATCVLIYNNPS